MVASEAGWKMFGSSSLVISSVFDGGDGCDSGGIEDKSSDIGECARLVARADGEEEEDKGGESVELDCAAACGGSDETSAMLGRCVAFRCTSASVILQVVISIESRTR